MVAHEEERAPGAPEWITTFVDMISLLVTFFILLFTFSSLEEYDAFTFRENILGTRGIIETSKGPNAVDPPKDDVMSAMDVRRGATVPHSRPPEELPENLQEMGQRLTERHVELDLKRVNDGIVLQFGPEASFGPGEAEVGPALRLALVELAHVMEHYRHLVVVEGFTDTEFEPSPTYPTPEALAFARARAASRVMLQHSRMSTALLQVAGLGMARPLNANATPTERTANRRVEIRILSMSEDRAREAGR